ncbi:PREDICTED: ankyrin repeat and SAM domain-containing protein 6-like [Nicrophorus vespilloides]|uniref:Ankyrin repeat and SAM domain-containing protein 6-like n=1 Tax=Nicrophorus vespilloides TaxID=110193 RepID=A0ABM1N930_NICVS|nr:PREDICTED: ankyrin repeat and SAM domain-containing protein 6-like [Nicrophorus vespilloides]
MEKTLAENPKTTFDDDKNSELHFASSKGDLDAVTEGVEKGQKIDLENFAGWTPLMMATRNGHVEVVRYLLSKRADATKKNRFGASIFMMAVASGNMDILREILNHLLCGGVSKQSMESKFSALSLAILFNHEDIFRYLLEKNFNVNATIPNIDLTPLMFAAINRNPIFSKLLLNIGANVNCKNINGETAHDILVRKQEVKVQQPVVQPQQQPPPQPPPQQVVYNQQPNLVYLQPPNPHFMRKSSEVLTPNIILSPNMSPIPPMSYHPQVFFPPEFMQHHIMPPQFNYPHGTIISPVPNFNLSSPCGGACSWYPVYP